VLPSSSPCFLLNYHFLTWSLSTVALSIQEGRFIRRIPLVIAHLQFSLITEVIFSGFELDLYEVDEWAPVYWYAAQNLESQSQTLERLSDFLEEAGEDRGASSLRVHRFFLEIEREIF
jgi:hypothetical protein